MTNQTAPAPRAIPTRIHLSENDKEQCDRIAREFLDKMRDRIMDYCEERAIDVMEQFSIPDENGDITDETMEKADSLSEQLEIEMLGEILEIMRSNY